MGLVPQQAGAQDMEVNKPEAAAPVTRDQSRKKYRDLLGDGAEDNENGANDHRSDDDTVDIAGGIGAAITPQVQQLLDRLAGELEPLRAELDRLRAREQDMHDKMERHPYLPVLNRQGLEHELSRVVGHIEGLGAAAFICVSVLSAEALQQTYGRKVYEEAMAHACEVLADVVKTSDSLGCLGGHDLGILALAPKDDVVDELARELREALKHHLFDCQGTSMALEVAVGGVMLRRGQGFDAALQAADSDLRS